MLGARWAVTFLDHASFKNSYITNKKNYQSVLDKKKTKNFRTHLRMDCCKHCLVDQAKLAGNLGGVNVRDDNGLVLFQLPEDDGFWDLLLLRRRRGLWNGIVENRRTLGTGKGGVQRRHRLRKLLLHGAADKDLDLGAESCILLDLDIVELDQGLQDLRQRLLHLPHQKKKS